MMSWTADPPDARARTSSFFSAESLVWISTTALQSATALSMLASAMAIFSSYSFLYFPNWVHLRLGLMESQSWSQSRRSPLPRPTSTRLWLIVVLWSRSTPSSLLRRTSLFLHWHLVDLLFRTSLTRPTGWREQRTTCRSRLMPPTPVSRVRTTRSTRSSRLEQRSLLMPLG